MTSFNSGHCKDFLPNPTPTLLCRALHFAMIAIVLTSPSPFPPLLPGQPCCQLTYCSEPEIPGLSCGCVLMTSSLLCKRTWATPRKIVFTALLWIWTKPAPTGTWHLTDANWRQCGGLRAGTTPGLAGGQRGETARGL